MASDLIRRREPVSMAKPKIAQGLVDKACEMKRRGLTSRDICQALGICEQAFCRWVIRPSRKLHRSLSEGLKRAKADYKAELLASIMDTATREKDPQWTAAAWLLERKHPDEYAQTTREKDEKREEAPRIVLGVTVQAAPAEAGDE